MGTFTLPFSAEPAEPMEERDIHEAFARTLGQVK